MKLPALKKGATLGVVAPAGHIDEERISPGLEFLVQSGFSYKPGKHLFGKRNYFSGTIRERIQDIHDFLRDPDVDALYAARGGWGSAQLLPEINFDLWRESGKLLIGFSDLTALQWSLWGQAGLPSVSGMSLTFQLRPANPHSKLFFEMLLGIRSEIKAANLEGDNLSIARAGKAEGLLLGGTLSIINTLLGTPFFPNLPPFILFIEDVNEPLYKIERLLVQLKTAGVLNQVQGLILGRFINKEKAIDVWPVVEYLFPPHIPVVANFPYGHFSSSCALPSGVNARLQTEPFRLQWE